MKGKHDRENTKTSTARKSLSKIGHRYTTKRSPEKLQEMVTERCCKLIELYRKAILQCYHNIQYAWIYYRNLFFKHAHIKVKEKEVLR